MTKQQNTTKLHLDFAGTNDALVTISLEKEKYQTSVKERSKGPVEWSEQCEL